MLKPLHDNVILKKENEENRTKSGIILSSSAAQSPCASVIAIGPDVEESLLTIGCRVLYNEMKAMNTRVDGEDYIVIRDKEIAAVIE